MREIKFRAWVKKDKVFTPKYVQLLKDGSLYVPSGVQLSQFTGLLDKNGVEIYEGDIFPCLYAFDGCTEHMMVVEYNEPRAGFFPRWDYQKCQQKGVQKTMRDLTRLGVIGNIYENEELLK